MLHRTIKLLMLPIKSMKSQRSILRNMQITILLPLLVFTSLSYNHLLNKYNIRVEDPEARVRRMFYTG